MLRPHISNLISSLMRKKVTVLDFAEVGSIVAIPASNKSVETVNFD